MLETVFLDAGGVLVLPNWSRISEGLARHGVLIGPDALARAEPLAKRKLDDRRTIKVTDDAGRGWLSQRASACPRTDLMLSRAGTAR